MNAGEVQQQDKRYPTQRRFLLHANPLLAGLGEIMSETSGSQICRHFPGFAFMRHDEKAQQEFMNIKYQNKVRLAKYIRELTTVSK